MTGSWYAHSMCEAELLGRPLPVEGAEPTSTRQRRLVQTGRTCILPHASCRLGVPFSKAQFYISLDNHTRIELGAPSRKLLHARRATPGEEGSNETTFQEEEGVSSPIAPESLSRSSDRDVHSRDDCRGTERDTFVEDRALSTLVTRALEACLAGAI